MFVALVEEGGPALLSATTLPFPPATLDTNTQPLTRVSVQHGTPPLLIAAGCGNIQIIEVLMRKGAEIQANDKVRTACRHGNGPHIQPLVNEFQLQKTTNQPDLVC